MYVRARPIDLHPLPQRRRMRLVRPPRSRAGRWYVLGGPTGRRKRRRHGKGRRRSTQSHSATSKSRRRDSARELTRADGSFTINGVPRGPSACARLASVRLADPGSHRHPAETTTAQIASRRPPRSSSRSCDRLRHAARSHHRLGSRRSAPRRQTSADHQCRPDDPGPGAGSRSPETTASRCRHPNPDSRGSSISNSNEPLYVVDGVPLYNEPTEPPGYAAAGTPRCPQTR